MEVGNRIGFPLAGVGMPGHFLVKPAQAQDQYYIDPFNLGQILSPEDCAQRVQQLYGDGVQLQPEFLVAVDKRQFLTRMLANLKAVYLARDDFPRALAAIERILVVTPDAAEQIRDRGLVLVKLEQYSPAVAALESYLALVPDAPDSQAVKDTIGSLWLRMADLD